MLVLVLLGVWLVSAVLRWLLTHWWVLALLAVVGVLTAVVWWRDRTVGGDTTAGGASQGVPAAARERAPLLELTQLDGLRHDTFEYAVRDLMRRDGCEAQRLGGSGDNGCDVLAVDPLGRRWVIQCKHRRDGLNGAAIGTPALQALNGTARPIHRADVVVLLTNGRFTRTAGPWARQQRMHLVDRQVLAQWASGARPLWELLGIPPPRRP